MFNFKTLKMKIIKYIALSIFVFASALLVAQENRDIIETKTVEKAKFLQDGVYVDKKVSILETRTQLVDTKPSQSHLLNQERLNTPIHVTKIIKIDSDNDQQYDLKHTITYKKINNAIVDLTIKRNDEANIQKDEILFKGDTYKAYLLGTDDTAVFGWVNEESEFVVDYF